MAGAADHLVRYDIFAFEFARKYESNFTTNSEYAHYNIYRKLCIEPRRHLLLHPKISQFPLVGLLPCATHLDSCDISQRILRVAT